MVCLGRLFHFKFFKGCFPQSLFFRGIFLVITINSILLKYNNSNKITERSLLGLLALLASIFISIIIIIIIINTIIIIITIIICIINIIIIYHHVEYQKNIIIKYYLQYHHEIHLEYHHLGGKSPLT